MINKTLAILAGGKSSRMNYNNKALLNYKERKFIEHIIDAGKGYKEIIIIANKNATFYMKCCVFYLLWHNFKFIMCYCLNYQTLL